MKILILTQWYPPEPQKLLSDLAQSLQKAGHEVEVLTGFPNYPSGQLYKGYQIKWRQRESLDGVPIIRVPLYPDHSRSSWKRIVNYVSFALAATILGPWLVRRPEVIFALHPPLTIALPAWLMSRVWRIPFTYNIQDMWPETLTVTGMVDNAKVLAVVRYFANMIYRAADQLIVISPGFRQNLMEKGVPAEKIHVVSNWVDVDHYRPVNPDHTLAERYGLNGRFNVMFAGVVGRAQGMGTILTTASLLRDLPRTQFVIVGDGVELPNLKAKASQLDLSNVRFLGRHPEQAMPDILALADVLLVHLKDTKLFQITIPHKVFTYMAIGKPIIAAVAGDAAQVVRTTQAGLVCQPDDPEALAASVRQLYQMSDQERQIMGQSGRHAACALYSRERLVGEVAKILAASAGKSALRKGNRRSLT